MKHQVPIAVIKYYYSLTFLVNILVLEFVILSYDKFVGQLPCGNWKEKPILCKYVCGLHHAAGVSTKNGMRGSSMTGKSPRMFTWLCLQRACCSRLCY